MALFSRTTPNPGYPLSEVELRKTRQYGPMYDLLQYGMLRNAYDFRDDFDGVALNTTNDWTVSVGAGATTWAVLAGGENGILRGVHGGTAATSGLQLSRPAIFKGSRNIGIEVILTPSNITEKRIEIGFANVVTAVNTTIVNSLTVPSFTTVTDCALYVYDHTGSTTTTGLYTLHSTAATATKTAFSPTAVPVAATAFHVRLEVHGAIAYLWVNSILVATGPALSMLGTTAVLPIINCKSSDTNTGNVDIDYVHAYAGRLL
jgi:hypothetical protein